MSIWENNSILYLEALVIPRVVCCRLIFVLAVIGIVSTLGLWAKIYCLGRQNDQLLWTVFLGGLRVENWPTSRSLRKNRRLAFRNGLRQSSNHGNVFILAWSASIRQWHGYRTRNNRFRDARIWCGVWWRSNRMFDGYHRNSYRILSVAHNNDASTWKLNL